MLPATPLLLSVMVRVPVSVPVAVGEKVTLIVQEPLAATLPPQVLVSPKLALVAMLAMVSVALPVLLRVTGCDALVVPTTLTAERQTRRRDAGDRQGLLGRNVERHVAVERGVGCGHLDCSRGCAGWHGGFDFGVRHDGERRRRAVKADATRTREIVAQNNDGSPHASRRGHSLYEGAKPHREAEDRATGVGPAPRVVP